MLVRACLLVLLPLAIGGCSGPPPSFKEAENLEAQANFEEAAQKFELVCAEGPASPECQQSSARAAGALGTAATKAVEKNEFGKAERLLLRALASADEPTAKDIEARLGKEDLTEGVRFEQAAADTDKARAFDTMNALAAGSTPAAALAKAWVEKERPGLLVAQVKAACSPEHQGSCAETFEKLEALPEKPPGEGEAKAAYDAEQKRTEKARAELDRFVAVFAQRGKKDLAFNLCLAEKASEIDAEFQRIRACEEDIYADGKSAYERFEARQTEDSLFRRRLATLGDPVAIARYEARQKGALATGEDPKKAAGGAK
ncbi:hypothetical protein [Polyangium mundeleinium]|uniref:Lipoprotein n=1 Tax=Polyangium mundeleinium TaxID=2995306 RepID=A0ABT5F1N6_9BACT|nr:hypothetical protein [Polyangium mundeleinium]MDC0747988.1 hypothetical protein [Polyangium mundeleinium]